MASIRKLPNSRFWIACFTDANGKQRQRSTKETDRTKANNRANDFESAYRKIQTEAQARRVLADISEEILGKQLSSPTISGYFSQWIVRKGYETDPATSSRYGQIANRFTSFLGDRSKRDLGTISTNDIESFRDHIASTISPGSANTHVKILRIAFQEAWEKNIASDNPAKKVKKLKVEASEEQRRAFTLDEMDKLLRNADSEWKGMILFGFYTGQRLGDIATLTWTRIDLKNGEVSFATRKTDRRFSIPLAPPLLNYLKNLEIPQDRKLPVFPNAAAKVKGQGRTSTLSNQFYSLMYAAKLVKFRDNKAEEGEGRGNRSRKRQTNELSFHCLRHTATSALKNAGVNDAVAMDIIGHDTQAISQGYTHIANDTRRNAVALMPDITAKPATSSTSPKKRVFKLKLKLKRKA